MVDAATIPLYGVILAGGSGTRFWPLSRSQYPKQVLRLLGSESMLQTTVERLLPRIPAERLAVVTNAGQAELIHQELHRKGWDEVRIWIEPEGRNTAAAVGLAAVYLGEEAEDGPYGGVPGRSFHPGPGQSAPGPGPGGGLGPGRLPGDLRYSAHASGDGLWVHQAGGSPG